jgi:protein required for attachment to host cells
VALGAVLIDEIAKSLVAVAINKINEALRAVVINEIAEAFVAIAINVTAFLVVLTITCIHALCSPHCPLRRMGFCICFHHEH